MIKRRRQNLYLLEFFILVCQFPLFQGRKSVLSGSVLSAGTNYFAEVDMVILIYKHDCVSHISMKHYCLKGKEMKSLPKEVFEKTQEKSSQIARVVAADRRTWLECYF